VFVVTHRGQQRISKSGGTSYTFVTGGIAALAAGFDEGLLVDEMGRISEGTITNVGFWRTAW